MFYRYDKETLLLKRDRRFIYLSLSLIIITNILSFGFGRYNRLCSLESYEKEVLIVNLKEEKESFTKERLVEELKRLNVKFPHIVMAQSIVETGYWNSEIFKENNNLFGMKEARVRIHTAQGTQFNHAYYNIWRESVYDYAFYQCRYLSNINTEDEYLSYLGQSYAEATNYVSILKTMIKREKLKEKFN